MNKKIKNNKGQVAVIVMLVSAVLLSLGLSVSKRAVIDTNVSTDEELLKEAFNAAESGINNFLNTNQAQYDAGDGSRATVDFLDIGGTSNNLSSEGLVLAGSNQLFWLVNHNDNSSIGSTYYSNSDPTITLNVDSGFSGALKIDYFYIDAGGNYKVSRLGCNYGGGNTVGGFSSNTSDCSNLILLGKSLLLMVTPIGGSTNLTILGSAVFPVQGQQLTAVGITDSGVKTQIKTRNIYQIPIFFTEAITAKNIIQ